MTNNKKKKRGERGSLEESPTVKKKPNTQLSPSEAGEANMADNQAGATQFQEEPTPTQLRDMLTDLQNSVSTILRKNNNLKEELAQIRATFQSQGRDIEDLKKKLVKVTNENQSRPVLFIINFLCIKKYLYIYSLVTCSHILAGG